MTELQYAQAHYRTAKFAYAAADGRYRDERRILDGEFSEARTDEELEIVWEKIDALREAAGVNHARANLIAAENRLLAAAKASIDTDHPQAEKAIKAFEAVHSLNLRPKLVALCLTL